jgi:bifunctional non-homologous end joining protein LigD
VTRRPAGRVERPHVAGVGISHPDRVMFPNAGLTKLDVARYYEAVSPWILPHIAGRPLTLVRCPGGIGASEHKRAPDCYYMRHSKVWAPPTIRTVRIRERHKVGEYLIVDDVPALVGLAQMDVLELHTWNSRWKHLEQPDRIVIDLDPGERVTWTAVVTGARLARSLLEALGLEAWVKTTGGRGLHVVVPVTPRADWSECLEFARTFADVLVHANPTLYTTRFSKSGRDSKILIDYLRNNRTNTSVAAFSTRARPGATVSMPVAWGDLSRVRPEAFTVLTVARRLSRRRNDPWSGYWTCKQQINRGAVRALAGL